MRKNPAVKIGLVCIALCCAAVSFAEGAMQTTVWKSVSSGIRDSDVRIITVSPDNPDTAYAGTRNVVYKTVDRGKTWDEILSFRGVDNIILTISTAPSDNNTVYAGTRNGLYMSSNGGRRWSRIYRSIRGLESYVLSVAAGPQNPSLILIGTIEGVYRTENGGKIWTKERALPTAIVSDIIIDRLNPRKIYASTSKGLYRSINTGSSWSRLFISSSGKYEKEVEDEDDNGPEDDGSDEYKDAKDGIVEKSRSRNIAVDPLNGSIVYYRSRAGIYLSRDSGSSWSALGRTGLSIRDIRHLTVNAADNAGVFAATGRGVFQYSPARKSWESLYKGLSSIDINYVASGPVSRSNNASLWAATARGVFKTESVTQKSNQRVEGMSAQDILRMFDHEPTMEEIRETAIVYASVDPNKIERWRKAAAKKAWLPSLSFTYQEKEDWQSSNYFYTTAKEKYTDDDITNGQDKVWSVVLSWNLSNLVWNTSQSTIELRSKAMVLLRDDLLNEVTRLYFERRRLQTEMITAPPKSPVERIEKELRLQELTAGIDALTGSYLSKRLTTAKNIQR